MTREEGMRILLDAAQSPHGLLLSSTNIQATVNAFERIRKVEQNPGLVELAFRRVDWAEGNLIIVKVQTQALEQHLPPELKGLQDL